MPDWVWFMLAMGGMLFVYSGVSLLVGIKNDLAVIRRILTDDHADRLERERRERGEW